MSGLSWYVVHSHPRKEAFVRDRIADLGRDVFLPLTSERSRRSRRSTIVPLFPSYLFARLSAVEGDLPRVRWTHGVRQVLGDQTGPAPVGDDVVGLLRDRADRTGRVRLGVRMRQGERVRIIDGPLAGLCGVLEKSFSTPEERVHVLLDLFQRPTRVELDAQAVRAHAGR